MDIVLVGLPGSGKTAVGRRLAAAHKAEFVDLDEVIERAAERTIPEIFEAEGEPGFRAREREAIARLGAADTSGDVRRVVATGGGAVLDPRNRWRLFRGRLAVWLDARPEVLAQRLRRSPTVRPLVAGRDPIGAMRALAAAREPFYAAAERISSIAQLPAVMEEVDRLVGTSATREGTVLLRSDTRLGRLTIGEGNGARTLADELERLAARRAVVVTEPGAWGAVGGALRATLAERGVPIETVELPQGEPAKRLAVVESAARKLAALQVRRDEPLVAVGGGALGDAAGLLAAIWLRGVPIIHVPTTLVAQIDSSIGGKAAVDLPEGKNLLGAFHQPVAVVTDVALLATLPARQLRAALGEAVKVGALGDERLLELLETDGEAIAEGDHSAFESGAVAEVVERCAWAKAQVVLADEREQKTASGDGRVRLNLGHTVAHGLEAASSYEGLLHGEAVAYGLRAASRLGAALGVTPRDRADRIEALLSRLDLGLDPLAVSVDQVLAAIGTDKKQSVAGLGWVLPTASGVEIRTDVTPDLVADVIAGVVAGGRTEAVRTGTERAEVAGTPAAGARTRTVP